MNLGDKEKKPEGGMCRCLKKEWKTPSVSVLCHDITQIIPGEFKGRAFKKGHIVTTEDIPKMLRIGKENLYVWNKKEGYLHEDEAALVLPRPLRDRVFL